MATIRARKQANGTTRHTAMVRFRKGKTIIHQEAKTFAFRAAAFSWAKQREVELERPGALERAQQKEFSCRPHPHDLTWIGVVLRAAKSIEELPINTLIVDEARTACRELRVIAKSRKRDRRPTPDELVRLHGLFGHRDRRAEIPMNDIMGFALATFYEQKCKLYRDMLRNPSNPYHADLAKRQALTFTFDGTIAPANCWRTSTA